MVARNSLAELNQPSISISRLVRLFSYMPTTEQLPSLSRSHQVCESALYLREVVMSNQKNILMMDSDGVMKDSDSNVIAKFATLKSELLLSTPSIEDLVKRIESLEKQLADMQKATSCELDSAIQNTLLQGVENGAKKAKELIKNQDFYQNPKQTSR